MQNSVEGVFDGGELSTGSVVAIGVQSIDDAEAPSEGNQPTSQAGQLK